MFMKDGSNKFVKNKKRKEKKMFMYCKIKLNMFVL